MRAGIACSGDLIIVRAGIGKCLGETKGVWALNFSHVIVALSAGSSGGSHRRVRRGSGAVLRPAIPVPGGLPRLCDVRGAGAASSRWPLARSVTLLSDEHGASNHTRFVCSGETGIKSLSGSAVEIKHARTACLT